MSNNTPNPTPDTNQNSNKPDLSEAIKSFGKRELGKNNLFYYDIKNKISFSDADLEKGFKSFLKINYQHLLAGGAFNLSSDDFDILKAGVEQKTIYRNMKKTTLENIIKAEYSKKSTATTTNNIDTIISDGVDKIISDEKYDSAISKIGDYISNGVKRKEFIKDNLPDLEDKDLLKGIEDIFSNLNVINLEDYINNSQDKDEIQSSLQALVDPNITIYGEDIKIFFDLIDNVSQNDNDRLKAKQDILKAFLPTVTLKDLVELNVITPTEAKDAVSEIVKSEYIKVNFTGNNTNVNLSANQSIEVDLIIDDFIGKGLEHFNIATHMFPETVLDKVITGSGSTEIAKAIMLERKNKLEKENIQNLSDFGGIILDATKSDPNSSPDPDSTDLPYLDIDNDSQHKINANLNDLSQLYFELTPTSGDKNQYISFDLNQSNTGNEDLIMKFYGNSDTFFGLKPKETPLNHRAILKELSEKSSKISVLTGDEIKKKKENKEIMDTEIDDYIESKTDIQVKISDLDDEINNNPNNLARDELDKLMSDKLRLEEYIEEKVDADGNPLPIPTELEEFNCKKLNQVFNDIDPEGEKYGIEAGTVFETLDDNNGTKETYTYTVLSVNDTEAKVKILSSFGEQEISYTDFISILRGYENSQDGEITRVLKENGFNSIKSGILSGNNAEKLKDWEKISDTLVDGKIQSNFGKELKYFESDEKIEGTENRYGYIIDNIDEGAGFVYYTLSQRSEESKNSKEKISDNPKENISTYAPVAKEQKMTLGEFYTLINKQNLKPDSRTVYQKDKADASKSPIKGGPFGYWWNNCFSISNIISGGEGFIKNIEAYLTQNNDYNSAKVAKILGKLPFLSSDIQSDLNMRFEREAGSKMEEFLKILGAEEDGKKRAETIERWLTNKHTPSYKKEAAVISSLNKYGGFYAEGPMAKHAGSFLYYRALGGQIGDEFYLEQKDRADSAGQDFSEELLVQEYANYMGAKGKMRTGFVKAIKDMHNGKKASIGVGEGKSKSQGTADEIFDILSEGSMKNKKPFEILGMMNGMMEKQNGGDASNFGIQVAPLMGGMYRGMMHNDKKDLLGESIYQGNKMFINKFAQTPQDNSVFDDAMLEICGIISTTYPEDFAHIQQDAIKVLKLAKDPKTIFGENGGLEKSFAFWKKYNCVLVGALTGKDNLKKPHSKYTKTNKLLRVYKDNPKIKEYKKVIGGVFKEWEDNVVDKDRRRSSRGMGGSTRKYYLKHFGIDSTSGKFKGKNAAKEAIADYFDAIKNARKEDWSDKPDLDKKTKIERFKELIKAPLFHIVDTSDERGWAGIKRRFSSLPINFDEFIALKNKDSLDSDDFLKGKNPEMEAFIDKAAEDLYNNGLNNISTKQSTTKEKVKSILDN